MQSMPFEEERSVVYSTTAIYFIVCTSLSLA